MTGGFEEGIRALPQPIDGQLPSPWMTAMRNPLEGEAFIVGRNQRNCYPAKGISHERHTDGLFNRSGESCRGLCDENTRGGPSPTRRNTGDLMARLNQQGVYNILEINLEINLEITLEISLETNAVCFSTPMSADLRDRANVAGARKGEEIFRYLLSEIGPAGADCPRGRYRGTALLHPENQPAAGPPLRG